MGGGQLLEVAVVRGTIHRRRLVRGARPPQAQRNRGRRPRRRRRHSDQTQPKAVAFDLGYRRRVRRPYALHKKAVRFVKCQGRG